ncbi:hypothetical protein CPB97_006264 [Podila verticillata]|nr:hypothetical protein CPB97_006264 [Podila verticillata]
MDGSLSYAPDITPPAIHLPVEILILIAKFTDRASLPACTLVAHQWHHSFLPTLWEQVSDKALKIPEFVLQLPLRLNNIRRLTITERTLSAQREPETTHLLMCRRLKSLIVDFQVGRNMSMAPRPSTLGSVRAFLRSNRLSLRNLCLLNLPDGSNSLLSEVQAMVSLQHLALDGWTDPSGSRLRQVFQDCKNLQSLSLAMNTLSLDDTTFEELAEAPYPITSIRRLVLDRSTISMDLLTNLARCMPHLKDLSLANTYGFSHSTQDDSGSWVDSDEEDSDDTSSIDNDYDTYGYYTDEDSDGGSDGSRSPSATVTDIGNGPVTSYTGEDAGIDPLASFSPSDGEDAGSIVSHGNSSMLSMMASEVADTTEPLEWTCDEGGKFWHLHQLCPNIVSFDFTGCTSDGVDDIMLTTICQLWGANLQALRFGDVCQFWDSTFSTIAQHCSRTLTILELSSTHHTPAHFALVQFDPMVQVLLECCQALEVLRIDRYPIRAGDIGAEPWLCSNLRELGIWIDEHEHNRDDGNRGHRTVRTNAYRQLGRLKHLKTLVLAGSEPFLLRTKPNPSPTDSLDWQLWANLLELEVLDVVNLDPSAMSEQTLVWMSKHWTGLRTITGSFLPARITEQLKAIGVVLTERSSYPMRGRSCVSGQGPPSQTTIELSRAVDPVTNGGLFKFRQLRPDVDIGAYMDVFDQCLKRNGLEIAPNAEPIQENWDLCRRHVQKVKSTIVSAAQHPVVRPGGRDNSEFMADVMRPRGGRSPSPLGTCIFEDFIGRYYMELVPKEIVQACGNDLNKQYLREKQD